MAGLTVADIDRWQPGDVREVFHAARSRNEANQLARDGLATLPAFQTWGGVAADAAKNSVEQTRKDLDADGREALAVAMAADRAADGIESVKARLQALRDALGSGLTIDPVANKIVATPAFTGSAHMLADKLATFQPQLDATVGQATLVDEELAQAIDMADGDVPIPHATPTIDRVGPDGLTPDQVAKDASQEKNQRDAFRQVYGRDPLSANDWRMAEGLDPHTYDPRYGGYESNVVVGRFTPIPGGGMYRQNMYIPGAEVQNFNFDPNRALPHMVGDNRGPSPYAPAEASRVSLFVDMDRGIIVARQNPTMSTDGKDAAPGTPYVSALQGDNGALMIGYTAADPFEPGAAKPFVNVNGTINIVPNGNGNVLVGGSITPYPSTEAYQFKPDGTVTQLFNQQVTANQLGPLTLPLPDNEVGASVPDLPRPWTPQMPDGLPPSAPRLIPTQPLPGTTLGPAANPPQIYTVPLAPPPPMSIAAPPLPVPSPPPLPTPPS